MKNTCKHKQAYQVNCGCCGDVYWCPDCGAMSEHGNKPQDFIEPKIWGVTTPKTLRK